MSRTVKKKVTDKSRTKALVGNFKRCTSKDVHEHIKFVMSGDNVCEWYFLLGAIPDHPENKGQFAGDDDEFLGGQFLGKITATKIYPYGPPDVEMLTPTGVFPLNNNDFCIDIGKYHKDNYPATLGMDGYTKMIWSGLMGWRSLGDGINLVRCSQVEQVKLITKASADSQSYNKKNNAAILDMFRAMYHDEKKDSVVELMGDMKIDETKDIKIKK